MTSHMFFGYIPKDAITTPRTNTPEGSLRNMFRTNASVLMNRKLRPVSIFETLRVNSLPENVRIHLNRLPMGKMYIFPAPLLDGFIHLKIEASKEGLMVTFRYSDIN